MFNSLASYLWGASTEVETSYTEAQSAPQADGEHLSTQQDEDWVVVGSGAGLPAAPAAAREEQAEEAGPSTGGREEGSTRRPGEGAVARHRPGALHPANHMLNTSPQRLLKKVHRAQAVEYAKSQKAAISRQKCERENMVQRGLHHKKGQNKLNKRVRPAGFKASRVSQRM